MVCASLADWANTEARLTTESVQIGQPSILALGEMFADSSFGDSGAGHSGLLLCPVSVDMVATIEQIDDRGRPVP